MSSSPRIGDVGAGAVGLREGGMPGTSMHQCHCMWVDLLCITMFGCVACVRCHVSGSRFEAILETCVSVDVGRGWAARGRPGS